MSDVLVTYSPRTRTWTVAREFRVTVDGLNIVIPAGFVTDLASVPRPLWAAESPFDLGLHAPIVHDWLYQHGGAIMTPSGKYVPGVLSRKQADAALYQLAADDGVWWWRRWIAYKAVRWFGAKDWANL